MSDPKLKELRDALASFKKEYAHDLASTFEYFKGRERHRHRTNITQLYYLLKKERAVIKLPPGFFAAMFYRLEEQGIGVTHPGKRDIQFIWFYETGSVGRFYLGGEPLKKTSLHPSMRHLMKKDDLKKYFGSLPPKTEGDKSESEKVDEAGPANDDMSSTNQQEISVRLRKDFVASITLPQNFTAKEAQKIIKFIEAAVEVK